MRASTACGGRSLSQYSQFGRSCRAMVVSSVGTGRIIANQTPDANAEIEGFSAISPPKLATQLLERQLRALLQSIQHDRRTYMRHALVRHQHVVDDIREAFQVAQHDLQQIVGVAGERIGFLDIVDPVDQRAKPLGVVARWSTGSTISRKPIRSPATPTIC